MNLLKHLLFVAPLTKGNKTSTKNGISQPERAKIIKRTLGTQCAARYLKARGWSIESALFYLAKV